MPQITGTDVLPEGVNDVSSFMKWLPSLIPYGLRILEAIVIILVGRKLIQVIIRLFDKSLNKAGVDQGVSRFLQALIRTGLYVVLVFFLAGELGFNTASIIAILGSSALAVGLSLQGSLANFAGSIVILLTRPFTLGDYIVSAHGEGLVKEIGLVYSIVVTPDNKQISIPNGALANDAVTNVTANPVRRLDLKIGISYGADLKKAEQLLLNLFQNSEWILKDKPVKVVVDALEDSDVLLMAFGWVKTGDYLNAKWDLTKAAKLCFDEHGIEIPFPQMDVHMIQ